MKKKQIEPYLSSYFHRKGRSLGLPVAGNFELTARCNFNCPMCYVHMTGQQVEAAGGELSAGQWLSIAREARDGGMIFALLTGGEPLMRRDFFEIYHGMKEMGLMVSINSNGSLLEGEVLERFLEEPPFRFNISLYGGSNETYRKMCGLPVYGRVKENIRALRKAGVDVSLNLSITPFNCHDLEAIYRDAQELDTCVRASSYMYPPVRVRENSFGVNQRLSASEAARCSVAWDALRFTREEFRLRAENMEKSVEALGEGCPSAGEAEPVGGCPQGAEPGEGCPAEVETAMGAGVRCRAGNTSFWLAWDGKMLPCGMMTAPAAYPLETGFNAAWEKIRTATAEIRTPSACLSCRYREHCGACAAVCYCETGNFDGVPAYVCEKTREQLRFTREICQRWGPDEKNL